MVQNNKIYPSLSWKQFENSESWFHPREHADVLVVEWVRVWEEWQSKAHNESSERPDEQIIWICCLILNYRQLLLACSILAGPGPMPLPSSSYPVCTFTLCPSTRPAMMINRDIIAPVEIFAFCTVTIWLHWLEILPRTPLCIVAGECWGCCSRGHITRNVLYVGG